MSNYSLTDADVDACRKILAQLDEIDQKVGGYYVDGVQGYTKSATVKLKYKKAAGAMATAEAAFVAGKAVAKLGLLCKKVIADYETRQAADR